MNRPNCRLLLSLHLARDQLVHKLGQVTGVTCGQQVDSGMLNAADRRWSPAFVMGRPPSIRRIVALLIVAPVIAVSIALVALTTATSHRIAENLGEQLLNRAVATVQDDMRGYLQSAVRISDLYARRIERGQLHTTALQAWEQTMLDDIVTNPDVASICFGNAVGNATWLLRNKGRLEVGRADGARDNFTQEFAIDPSSGSLGLDHPIREYRYDPRQRPWYALASEKDAPQWTPIYFWFGESGGDLETGAGYTRSIRDAGGAQRGVLVVDVTLGAISAFLHRLPLADHGAIFVIDDAGLLVASSQGHVNSEDGRRLTLQEYAHASARAAATALESGEAHSFSALANTGRLTVDGEPARIRLARFDAYPGIRWTIVCVVPERVFLADAQSVQRRAVIIGLAAAGGALALGLILSRSLSSPILRLRSFVRRIGAGDFDGSIDLRAARELRDLSSDLTQMARDLEERMHLRASLALATEVQQSLLPAAPPHFRGLDIAGQSRYCDSTGGDYFDFIEVAESPRTHMIIAVGDVMGHGIASALWMATARAALRATAFDEGALSLLLTRVNDVLARDAQHGRFMTMALAIVDPESGTMRWASAGHDPPIIYSPARGEFRALEGGDIPLGVAEGVRYEEYTISDIEPASIIVIGTDGIWEAPDANGNHFGKERLREVIVAHAGESAQSLSDAIHRALTTFSKSERFPDDVTFVVVKTSSRRQ